MTAERPAARQRPVTFRALAGAGAMASLRGDWMAVVEGLSRARYLDRFEWWDAYARELADDPASLRFFVAEAGGAPVAVFPLASRRRRIAGVPVRALELPAHDHLCLRDLVFERAPENEGLLAAFVAFLESGAPERFDVLFLENVLDDSPTTFSLRGRPPPRTLWEPGRVSLWADTTVSFEELQQRLNQKFRYSLRKRGKQLAALPGGLEVLRITRAEELDAALDEFMALEAAGWKGKAGTAIRCDPRLVAFYRSVSRDLAASGGVEIDLLRAGGRCIAGQFCLKAGRSLYLMKPAYDETLSKLGPGHLFVEHILRRCATERDVDAYNFVSDAEWLRDWKPSAHEGADAFVFTGSPAGRAAYLALAAKQRLRPLYRRAKGLLRGRGAAAAAAPAAPGAAASGDDSSDA